MKTVFQRQMRTIICLFFLENILAGGTKMENKTLKILELFGGIGAPRKALENLGFDIRDFAFKIKSSPFCQGSIWQNGEFSY